MPKILVAAAAALCLLVVSLDSRTIRVVPAEEERGGCAESLGLRQTRVLLENLP
jgi:hypothetical protein